MSWFGDLHDKSGSTLSSDEQLELDRLATMVAEHPGGTDRVGYLHPVISGHRRAYPDSGLEAVPIFEAWRARIERDDELRRAIR